MSDYEFPFSNVDEISEVFSGEVIPFCRFGVLEALRSGLPSAESDNYDEIDSDIIFRNRSKCSYLDLNSYNDLVHPKNNLSLLFMNVNSLPKHHDAIVSQFTSGASLPKVFGFCETKLSEDIESLFSIPGYRGVYNSKSTRSGGLALFIQSNIKFEIISQNSYMLETIESLCVKIYVNGDFVTLCLIYRRPGTRLDEFFNHYSELMQSLQNSKCLIFGDFNFDLMKYETCHNVESFVNLNFEHYFFPLINRPTRVSSHSATVIDHIWCNFVENFQFDNKIILTDFSDHFALYTSILEDFGLDAPPGQFSYRDWTNLEDEGFHRAIATKLSDFHNEVNSCTIDSALDKLVRIISSTLDEYCPVRVVSPRKKGSPWITTEVKQLIKEKNRLFSKYCRRPITFGDEYRRCRNRLNNMIKSSKKLYYANLLNVLQNDSKKTWSVLNEILNRKSNRHATVNKIRYEDGFTSNQQEIVNIMNDHFVSTPQNIAQSLEPIPNINYRSFLTGYYSSSFFLNLLNSDKILKILSDCKNTSSGGHLDIPIKVVTSIIHVISEPLCFIFNRCITTGYFPNNLKIAQVTPVFKAGESTNPNNYRPISVLTIFSKILEKHIYSELLSYLDSFEILNAQQCGFREGISTNIAIGKFLRRVFGAVNDGKFSVGVFLDLQKAFDCVNHDILLGKLYHYGVRGVPYELFKSFLSDRRQYVKIGENRSHTACINIGTPQGSILSPLLFLVFINDIINSSRILNFNLFADDTCVFLENSDINILYSRLNRELVHVQNWISANRLSLNVSKTVYLLFSGRKTLNNIPPLYLSNQLIQRKNSTKFLGLIIDDKLSWKDHTSILQGKLSRLSGVFYKIKNYLPSSALKTLYYALVHPHLSYGLVFWSSVNKAQFNKLFRLQKKFIRFIANSGRLAHTNSLFCNLSILKLEDLKKLEMAKFVFKDICGPNFFNFSTQSSLHSHYTRNHSFLSLPRPRTNLLLRSVFYEGPKIFNSLDRDIKTSNNVNTFKLKFKYKLVSSYNL